MMDSLNAMGREGIWLGRFPEVGQKTLGPPIPPPPPPPPENVLKGWMAVQKNVINETWRESDYKLLHNAIYGFNVPPLVRNPDRITKCPKCTAPLTAETWHGIWSCKAIQAYCDGVLELISQHWSITLDKITESLIFHYVRPPDDNSIPLCLSIGRFPDSSKSYF